MKNRASALFAILLAFAASPVLSAQDYVAVPVKVSTEKVRLNGKIYLSHPVQDRQTLFGIAKAYGVSVDDLYAANPDLREKGLQKGTTLLIPILDGKAAEPAFKEHTVMWYEDIEDIAEEYGVTVQEIMAANGMKSKKVTKRQVLRIPVKGTYTVKKEEAEVAPPDIPTLSDPEIKDPDMVSPGTYKPIKVDKVTVKKADVLPPEVPTIADPVIADPEMADPDTYKPLEVDPLTVDPAKGRERDEDGIFDWLTGNNSVEMALLLPFNAAGRTSETDMDFYAGVLMALRDLEAEGAKIQLNVYDLKAGVPSTADLQKNDFILGPVSTQDLSTVLGRTAGQTPVISPLDQRAGSLADSHEGFIQAPSSADSQYADLADWAAKDCMKGDRIILVTEKTSGSTTPAVRIRNALLADGTEFEGVSWTVAEGRSLPAALTSRLTKSGVNRIIVASEKETFVGDVVRNLGILLGRGYQAVMYAPSRVRTFETVDGSAYHQVQLHISSPYFAEYDSAPVKAFVRSFRALYRTEPSQFAFQGYDLARFFAGTCARYGKRWTRALERVTGTGLHTDFNFVGAHDGSFRNTGIRRIVYHTDYSTELIR